MPDYIIEPLETDPEVIRQDVISFIQAEFPEWEPSEGQLDQLILRATSLKAAVIADMASRVQRSIYRYFGATVTNILPIAETYASVVIDFVAMDTDGHTIDGGTQVGLVDANGDIHLFSTVTDAVIPAASNSVQAVAEALEAGTADSGLSGPVQLVEQIDWLESASTVAPSAGGGDPEDDETYLNRLTNNLGLMAPRPILAPDFAIIARNIPGVWRAIAIDNYLPGTNQVNTIDFTGTVSGGTYTLTLAGETTASINWNDSAATVQARLEALANTEAGDVTVTGGPGPTDMTVTHKGRFVYTSRTMSATSSLTGGGSVSVTTATAAVAANTATENAVAVAAIDQTGIGVTGDIKTELDEYLQSLRQQNFVVSVVDPSYTTIDVTFTVVKLPGSEAADVDTRAEGAVTSYFDSANWGIPDYPADGRGWERKTALRIQEIYTILNNVPGVDYVSALTFSNGAGATQDGTDKTLTGTFPITRPGTIAGTVV
jgi:hypothetical protein